MRVFWTAIKYLKNAACLFDREYVNRGGLDISNEVMWVALGQRAAELLAVKVGGWKKFCNSAQFKPD